jgi:CBS domain-containing protein
MQAAEIMTREVATVAPCATTAEIATAMANGAVSDIPVCDADGNLLGMVSEDDLTRYVEHEREIWRGWWSQYLSVGRRHTTLATVNGVKDAARDLMHANVFTVGETTPVADIVEVMLDQGLSRVPVLRDGKLIGVVTRSDLLKTMGPAMQGGYARPSMLTPA